ncbi:MAG TPA: ABC transporter permease [Thermoanaerobaculia bacterium]|nr:ABC transporter permease [Thermoanaerobaculia bacterium]
MSSRTDTSLVNDPQPAAPASLPETRPIYWSVRRELWENRSIYIAPLIVAGVVFLGLAIHTLSVPGPKSTLPGLQAYAAGSYNMAPAPIMLATFLVGLFYSLDALYGERRDRSILFWKSLPVSDLTTVLSKAIVPLVALPLIAFVLSVATKFFLALFGILVLLANGKSPSAFWTQLHFPQEMVVMAYGLAVHTLWFAPIYGWALLLSAWARRVPFLWAVLPPAMIFVAGNHLFNSPYLASMLKYRVTGAMETAFTSIDGKIGDLSKLTPSRFLSTPGLWIGLIFAAVCIAAAVRLRRKREPI